MRRDAFIVFLFACRPAWAETAVDFVDPLSLLGRPRYLTPGERAVQQTDPFSVSAESVLASTRESHGQYQAEVKHEADARERADQAKRRQSELEAEKEQAINELRHGQFCSGCMQTRSQILAKGEQFPHPGQRVIYASATPAQMDAKRREYDGYIDNAKAREAGAYQEAAAAAQRKQTAAENVVRGFARWRTAMLAEDEARAKAWEGAVATYKRRLALGLDTMRRLNDDIARLERAELKPPSRLAELQELRTRAQAQLRQLSDEASEDYFSRNQETALFDQRVSKGRAELERFVGDVGGPLLGMPFPLPNMPNSLPMGPVSIRTTQDSVELGAGIGKFKASIQMSSNWLKNSLNVDLSIGLAGGSIGIRQTTDRGAQGTTMTTTPIISLPKDLVLPSDDPLELLRRK